MKDHHSSDYFERRAEEERLAAEQASDERAAHSHRDLAAAYRKLASGIGRPVSGDSNLDEGILPKDFRIVP